MTAGKAFELEMNQTCFICQKLTGKRMLHELTYKSLVERDLEGRGVLKKKPNILLMNVNFMTNGLTKSFVRRKQDIIPEKIRAIHPKMAPSEYEMLEKDEAFLNRGVIVCENCFLEFTAKEKKPKKWINEENLKKDQTNKRQISKFHGNKSPVSTNDPNFELKKEQKSKKTSKTSTGMSFWQKKNDESRAKTSMNSTRLFETREIRKTVFASNESKSSLGSWRALGLNRNNETIEDSEAPSKSKGFLSSKKTARPKEDRKNKEDSVMSFGKEGRNEPNELDESNPKGRKKEQNKREDSFTTETLTKKRVACRQSPSDLVSDSKNTPRTMIISSANQKRIPRNADDDPLSLKSTKGIAQRDFAKELQKEYLKIKEETGESQMIRNLSQPSRVFLQNLSRNRLDSRALRKKLKEAGVFFERARTSRRPESHQNYFIASIIRSVPLTQRDFSAKGAMGSPLDSSRSSRMDQVAKENYSLLH